MRQYIGARYVPIYFENTSTGDSTWAENTIYDRLVIVLYNSTWYISKKEVPASVGSPNLNTDYWVAIGSYNPSMAGFEERLTELETEFENLTVGSEFAVPQRDWTVINNQSDFENFLAEFNEGEVSHNCEIRTPGTYQFKLPNNENRVVFTSLQMHINCVAGVILDFRNCVFYTSHIQISGPDVATGVEPTASIIDSVAGQVPYFEGCTLIFNHLKFETLLRMWSCFTTATRCWFTNADVVDYNDSLVDVIQGIYISTNCYYITNQSNLPNNYALFGIGNGAIVRLCGRTGLNNVSSENNVQIFKSRQQNQLLELYINGTVYSIEGARGYDANYRGEYKLGNIGVKLSGVSQQIITSFKSCILPGSTGNFEDTLITTYTF